MILDILSSNRKVEPALLAEMLDVSMVTLRKDLDFLEKYGIDCRKRGMLSLDGVDETYKKLAFFHLVKRRIASAAVQIVGDNETVMIDSGSCCAMFAEELVLSQKNATIVTNSSFVLNYISRLPDIKVIFLGGYYQPKSKVMIGKITTEIARKLNLDKYFLGTDGFISGQGFTGQDHLCVETAIELSKYAKNIFMLTESAKFNRCGTYNLLSLDKFAGVFTDDKIPKEAELEISKNDVKLYKVSSSKENTRWHLFPGLPTVQINENDENRIIM